MKEATSEMSSSAVVLCIIVVLALFFFNVVWPNIKGNMSRNASCADAVCNTMYDSDGLVECHAPSTRGGRQGQTFRCPYKG